MTEFDRPTFVRLEYLNPDGTWWVAHAGINLLNPRLYLEKLLARGVHARVIEKNEDWQDGEVLVLPETLLVLADTEWQSATKYGEQPEDYLGDGSHQDDQEEVTDMVDGLDALLAENGDPPLLILDPDTYDYVFDGHAGASPSGAERWMHCTSSLQMTREFLETLTPRQLAEQASGSSAARQGTTAHSAGEAAIRLALGEIDEDELDDILTSLALDPAEGEEYDEDMAEHVLEYTDLIQSYIDDRGADSVRVESRVGAIIPLSGSHEGESYTISGSLDCSILPTDAEPDLVVADYKHGKGVDVPVQENPQLRIYALGVLAEMDDDDIAMTETVTYYVVQPRSGGVKVWQEPLDDLLDWCWGELSEALTAALYGEEAEFNPSDSACQWCLAKGACPALTEQRVADGAKLFSVIQDAEEEDGPGAFPETALLDNVTLGELLKQVQDLTALEKDLKEEAQRRLHRGDEVPNFKLISYTPAREWVEGADEELDERYFKDPALLTPTQALALAKQARLGDEEVERLNSLIHEPTKRPIIAKESSNRKEWVGRDPADMFEVLGEDD